MAGERMVPLLPCASIDEIADFAAALGFTVTYRQMRPNPYLALRREGIEVHYFGMDGFRPEDSYSTCVVVAPDPGLLFDAFADGLRQRYGRLPLTGIPRITRPRRRKNADGRTGFSLVDPGGNWIRVTAAQPDGTAERPTSRLARTLADAVVLGDSHGDVDQAAKVLAGAVRRHSTEATAVERVEALAYLAELAARRGDVATVEELVARIDGLALTAEERVEASGALAALDDLRSGPTGSGGARAGRSTGTDPRP
jgi:hypothetical protein